MACRTRRARRHLKSLPSRTTGSGCRGSNQLRCPPRKCGGKQKTGLHPSVQAMRLSRWGDSHLTAGACSLGQDRGHPASRRPLFVFLQSDRFPSFRAIPADVLKGMISYRIGFSECEHRRASNGQHARKPLFSESRRACQGFFCSLVVPAKAGTHSPWRCD